MINKSKTPLAQAIRAIKPSLWGIGLTSCFSNLLILTIPLYMLQLFDRVLASRSVDTLLYLTAVAIGALLILALLEMLRSQVMSQIGLWLEQRLGPNALSGIISANLENNNTGIQPLRDINQLRQFLSSSALNTLFDAPWVFLYLWVIYLLHPKLGAIATMGCMALFALVLLSEFCTRAPLTKANQLRINNFQRIDSAAHNAEVIEAMGLEAGIQQIWQRGADEAARWHYTASQRGAWLSATAKWLRFTLQLTMLGYGAWLVLGLEISGGAMIVGSIILGRAMQPIEQCLNSWKSFVSARDAFRRLGDFFANETEREREISLPPPTGNLSVEKIYASSGGSAILKGVSFNGQPGEVIAIVGSSASGKSTLARLLVGARKPTRGVIRLDGADVFRWDRQELGRYLGYLPQDIELFNASIADNIARFDQGEDRDKQLVKAAKQAGVHELILQLPHGYQTIIGSGGVPLSGGQRQRIGLARALYRQPKLLVLDEPNSNLDLEGERALIAAIKSAAQEGALVIFISHQPNLVYCADKLIVLKQGTITMNGEARAVMRKLSGQLNVVQQQQQQEQEVAR